MGFGRINVGGSGDGLGEGMILGPIDAWEAKHYTCVNTYFCAMASLTKKSSRPKSEYFRLNLTLPHELDAELAKIGYRARSTGGMKLRKTEILRALIRLLLELEIDVDGVKDEDEFLIRLRRATGRSKGGK